ncbi:unnamed protein product [Spirodela intermedia]|uniref:Uncharacterized protein n=1 Tax=Spirodela intermedia TaxID=51605 RepID=A0A7I8IDH3_SPIIN|nr:unnamed protein product [Spirodela intermedia]CAA6654891.1 unnamed protein product [Spirodela intermedia]
MKVGDREAARDLRKMKREAMAARAVKRYDRDPEYRFLHDRVADLFAELLRADMETLRSEKPFRISLAAKWCPSLDSSFDRSTLICESIARRVFPREAHAEYQDIEDEHYAYRVRDRLRKEVLVPLRRKLELPEVYMGANQWSLLPYNQRFAEYLGKVAEGKAKIAAGALLPHQILAAIREREGGDEVAELQWRRMVKDLSDKGKLRDCLAVCDVSGSMAGTPMEVCIALGMLISELSEEPWSGKVITFSHEPELHRIKGTTLREKMMFMENMDFCLNIDFQRVFDQILMMIKRLFVFSDMEFDEASENSWKTDYEAIQRKFGEHGYGSSVPEILFWNLKSSRSVQVMGDQKRVALISGFSKNFLKVFLEGDGPQPCASHGGGHRRGGIREARGFRLRQKFGCEKIPRKLCTHCDK